MSNQKSLTKKILLWIALIPASFMTMILVFIVWRVIHYITGFFYISGDTWLNTLFTDIMSNFMAGAAFIYAAFRIAPSHKRIVSIAMAGLLLFISGASFFIANFINADYSSNIGIISGNIGSILWCIMIYQKEIED